MSRRTICVAGVSLGLVLLIAVCLCTFVMVEMKKIETQRKMYFEQRASGIWSNTESRMRLLKKNWENDRKQVLDEGMKLIGLFDNPKDHADQIGQWLQNVDGNYRSEETDLLIEETHKIAQLREQVWGE